MSSSSARGGQYWRGDGGRRCTQAGKSLTIPKLLLILEVVRHFKCHTVCADQPPKPLSPVAQALGVIVRGAKRSGVFGGLHTCIHLPTAAPNNGRGKCVTPPNRDWPCLVTRVTRRALVGLHSCFEHVYHYRLYSLPTPFTEAFVNVCVWKTLQCLQLLFQPACQQMNLRLQRTTS